MSEHIEIPERVVLAGDMAWHFGLALASTNPEVGVFASMHYDLGPESRHKSESPGRRFEVALARIVKFVADNVDDSVDDAVFEHPTPHSSRSSAVEWQMVGMFELATRKLSAKRADRDVFPNTLKLWATGHGQAKKPAMIARANELASASLCPRAIYDNNEADAVCLAALYAEHVRNRELTLAAKRLQASA